MLAPANWNFNRVEDPPDDQPGFLSGNAITTTPWAVLMNPDTPVLDFENTIKNMAYTYPFELDNFQKQAILKLEEGCHIMVTAHTSAGKTAIAEYAIAMSLQKNKRAIYTAPVKALSNQKYYELKRSFGTVGLITGDMQESPDAPCLVMTTEILRSKLYDDHNSLEDLDCVIFDEIHYINHAERGYVWDELLMQLPNTVRIVMLSATIPNALQFGDWVGRLKDSIVYVISTERRPVPLVYYMFNANSGQSAEDRFLILDEHQQFNLDGYNAAVAADAAAEELELLTDGRRRRNRYMPSYAAKAMWIAIVNYLQEENKLPMIAFIFSRVRCDENMDYFKNHDFTTPEEKAYIKNFFRTCILRLNEADRTLPQVLKLQNALERGTGVHHSGLLPVLKEIVEILYQRGYIKVLFATETFAIGVNMPARTVIFDGIMKFDGHSRRPLTSSEFIQMAGRAGRRGLDTTGTVIVLCKGAVPELQVLQAVLLGPPEKLSSRFRWTYKTMLVYLCSNTAIDNMIKNSFREIEYVYRTDSYRDELVGLQNMHDDLYKSPLEESLLERLVLFFHTAARKIEILDELNPLLLNVPAIKKKLVPGRVLKISVGTYINQHAVLLNCEGTHDYNVMVLKPAEIEDEIDVDDVPYDEYYNRMLSFTTLYDIKESDLNPSITDFCIITVAPGNIVAIGKPVLNINPKNVKAFYERNYTISKHKYASARTQCYTAVRELKRYVTNTSPMKYIGYTNTTFVSDEIQTLKDDLKECQNSLNIQLTSIDPDLFKSEFETIYQRQTLQAKIDRCNELMSFKDLPLYTDYQRRLMVLKRLDFVNRQYDILQRGRFVSMIGSYELILAQMIFKKVFLKMGPAEIVALLSCLVFHGKVVMYKKYTLSNKLNEGMNAVRQIETRIRNLEEKYEVEQYEGQQDSVNFDLVGLVYLWAMGTPFTKIVDYSDVQEGIIVKCIQHVSELIGTVMEVAVHMRQTKLQKKMKAAAGLVKADIINTVSIYTHENVRSVDDNKKKRRKAKKSKSKRGAKKIF